MRQLSFDDAFGLRDAAMAQVADNAGEDFAAAAQDFILAYLRLNGPTAGERLTDAALEAGIVPTNTTRAFGPVYYSLARQRLIERAGTIKRRKGHGTTGGNIWRLVQREPRSHDAP